MKYFILHILFILTLSLPSYAENKFEKHPIKKIEANPINVAVMLTEQLDSADMASTCEYYGYQLQPSQNGQTVYQHPNGSIIRYSLTAYENGKKYPAVEVKSKGTMKEKNGILEELNFKHNGSGYERRGIGYATQCSSAPQGISQTHIVIDKDTKIKQ